MLVRPYCLLLAVVPIAAASGQATGPLSRAGWLAGCWELRAPNRVVLEMWMPPLGDLMLGASRTTVGTATSEYEQLRLKADGDRIVYTATPSGQRETSFPSIIVTDTAIVFENTTHDFPQRIIYQRRGTDSLLAWIEGPGPNGSRRIQFPYRRSNCLTVAPPTPPDTFVLSVDLSRDGRQPLGSQGITGENPMLPSH